MKQTTRQRYEFTSEEFTKRMKIKGTVRYVSGGSYSVVIEVEE